MSTGKPAPWTFRSRFRRGSFGWRGSKPAIARIDEAQAEIRAAARSNPAHGAEGAVLFLEKLSPALSNADSSSGALGNATAAAVATLVPLIGTAPVADSVRDRWLERLYTALEEDGEGTHEERRRRQNGRGCRGDHLDAAACKDLCDRVWGPRLHPCTEGLASAWVNGDRRIARQRNQQGLRGPVCDRFVRYGALAGAPSPEAATNATGGSSLPGLEAMREPLSALMAERPGGVKGAQLKPQLKNRVSVTFNESEYGFARLSDLVLRATARQGEQLVVARCNFPSLRDLYDPAIRVRFD